MISSKKVLKNDNCWADPAERCQRRILALLGGMIGPDGRSYLDIYLRNGVCWLWDRWFVDWENAHHQATLLPPSREQVEALERLSKQLFFYSYRHHFMWLLVKVGRFLYGHH